MFELYTEKARRVIFFARYEASQYGSSYIEAEHLLLAVLREDKQLLNRILTTREGIPSMRQEIEKRTSTRPKVSASVDLPLSNQAKRVLHFAGQESQRLQHGFIGTGHILLGLVNQREGIVAEVMKPLHLDPELIAESIGKQEPAKEVSSTPKRFFGKYRGTVISNRDPLQLGRIQAQVPDVEPGRFVWATPCIPYPAALIPTLTVPPVGASVWMEYEGGDPDYPIWSGCFWVEGQTPLLKLP